MALVERAPLCALVPGLKEGVVGAVHYREDGRLIPGAFVRALAAAATRHGAAVHEHATVFALERSGPGVRAVHTSRGTLRPRAVVLATGFLSPSLGRDVGLRVPVQPAKGYSITVRRPATCPQIPLHFHEEQVVLTPFGPDRMRIGGTLELAGNDRSVSPRRLAAIRRAAPRYLAGMEELETLEIWRGMRPLSADSLPILGRPARPGQPAAGHRPRHDRHVAGTGQRQGSGGTRPGPGTFAGDGPVPRGPLLTAAARGSAGDAGRGA